MATDIRNNISAADSPIDLSKIDSGRGLSEETVRERRATYGPNEIPEKEETLWNRIGKRFWGPIPWMIEAAAILSALVRKWEDFVIITILLLVNVFIDFKQESQALNALKILKSKLARKAIVLRDGVWRTVDARDLVPGDVIKLRIGNIIPADVALLRGDYLQVDQSALTGESFPVDKKAGETAYGNSVVKKGEMTAAVTGTGTNTYFGKTVALVAKAEKEQKSHFQKAVINVGNFLILIATAMIVVILFVGLFRHDPFGEILRFSLVLAVASIPVALPAVLSVTMAVGAVQLSRRQAIVSRLASIEELAGMDVLCCDKTGTLTKNEMSLAEPLLYNGATREDAMTAAALASREEDQDPLEIPIYDSVNRLGLADRLRQTPVRKFVPFDPVIKRTEATIDENGKTAVTTKGAPQAILRLCQNADLEKRVSEDVATLARKGYRTLGVAVKRNGAAFTFLALLPFYDPPREDSKETIRAAIELGTGVKMVTGDNIAIAREMAAILGIKPPLYDIQELRRQQRPKTEYVKKHETALSDLIEKSGGFAQVFPEDKYMIVENLQKKNHIVAMTGDGVNDAPALKKADAGIAVSGATDAARAAADVILTTSGLSVILHAIREARKIFTRMKSYSIFRISETIRIVFFITLSITIFNFYPVTALMIIILALLNDLPIMAIAYDNARIEPAPVRWDMKEVLTVSTVLGLLGVCSSFLVFAVMERFHFPRDLIQAVLFLKLDVAGHSTIYVARTHDKPFWHKPYPSYKLLVPALGTRLAGTLIACYGLFMTPVGWTAVGIIYLYATAWFLLNDAVKVQVYQLMRRTHWIKGVTP